LNSVRTTTTKILYDWWKVIRCDDEVRTSGEDGDGFYDYGGSSSYLVSSGIPGFRVVRMRMRKKSSEYHDTGVAPGGTLTHLVVGWLASCCVGWRNCLGLLFVGFDIGR